METNRLEHIVHFRPAFDKRSSNPSKDYGIHGVDLAFILKGSEGAVQFVIYTNWQLPHVQKELDRRHRDHDGCHPMPSDLGYHSPKPRYKGQESMGPCEYLDGKDCYYDGSGLNAERMYELLLTDGSDAVWNEMETYYHELFDEKQ